MAIKARLVSLWRNLLRKDWVEQELSEELNAYVEMLVEEKIKEGFQPAHARRAALIEFGGVEQVKESVREVRMGQSLETMWQDLGFGVRMLFKNKLFTAVAVLTLALAIGANTTIFSVVQSILLRPLPYEQADRLLQFRYYSPPTNDEQAWVAARDVLDWQAQSRSFERIGVYTFDALNLTEGGLPEVVVGLRVSADLLPTLGVPPALGRYFSPEEDEPGRNRVIVLSDELWRRRFGADPDIIGRTIRADRGSYIVVGIMPPGFNFPLKMPTTAKLPTAQMGYWSPLGLSVGDLNRADAGDGAIARLKPGVNIEQAQAEMNQIAAQLTHDYPQTNTSREVRLVSLKDQFVGEVRFTLLILLGAVGLVVLIACANISNLLLVRADGRRHEMAIRRALGASRLRLMRQALTETLLLALGGGAAGVLLASGALPLLLSLSPQAIPRLIGTRVDGGVLSFTLAVSVFAGLLFGLAPAWRSSRGNLNEDLKQAAGTASRKRGLPGNALIVVEMALALILTLGASLLLNSFVHLLEVDPGFHSDRVLAAVIWPRDSQYPDAKSRIELYRRIIERVKALPGVESAAATNHVPFSGSDAAVQIRVEGPPPVAISDPSLQVDWSNVFTDFLQTMGIPLLRGRFFNERDTADSPGVVVISEAAAERIWPGEDPLGKRLSFFGVSDNNRGWRQVVGIVQNTRNAGLDQPQRPHVYTSVEQMPFSPHMLLVRSALPSKDLADAVRQSVAAEDKEQPIYLAASLEAWIADSLAERRFALLLLGLFGALALVLASVGVYGVVAYAAAQRTREIGIRMSLGAQPKDVLRLVIRQGMEPALLGLVLGLLGGLALTRLLKSLLFGVSATDPLTFVLVAALLGGMALAACWLAARRAAKVDPMIALRSE